jgi:hypothetical protein
MAIDGLIIEDKRVGFSVLPAQYVDTKEKVVEFFLGDQLTKGAIDHITKNMPGSDKDWARIIGYHEGGHLDNKLMKPEIIAKLEEETKCDRGAIKEISKDEVGAELALALKDLRTLSNNVLDPGHATSGLLNSNDPASSLHIEIAKNYKNEIIQKVTDNFDFGAYEGKATTPTELLLENPKAFFGVVNDAIEQTNKEALVAYNSDPSSYEAIETIVGAQIYADYAKSFEGAIMRRVHGQLDYPDSPPTQLIPQEVEDQFYADLEHRNKLNFIENEHRIDAIYIKHAPNNHVDWQSSYKGKAQTFYTLKYEAPEIYFGLQKEYLENLKTQTLEQAIANPSLENLDKAIAAQHAFLHYGQEYNEKLPSRKKELLEEIKNEKEYLQNKPEVLKELRAEIIEFASIEIKGMTEEELDKYVNDEYDLIYGRNREEEIVKLQKQSKALEKIEKIDVTPFVSKEMMDHYYETRLRQQEQAALKKDTAPKEEPQESAKNSPLVPPSGSEKPIVNLQEGSISVANKPMTEFFTKKAEGTPPVEQTPAPPMLPPTINSPVEQNMSSLG